MSFSDFDKQKFYDILCGDGDWFHAHLARLMAKADDHNFARLQLAFPKEAATFLKYRKTGKATDQPDRQEQHRWATPMH